MRTEYMEERRRTSRVLGSSPPGTDELGLELERLFLRLCLFSASASAGT